MKRRLKRWGIGLLIGIVVAVPVILLLRHWLNTSSNGSVHVGTPTGQATQPLKPLPIRTPYFTTVLPAGFNLKRQTETPDATTQLQLLATTSATLDQQFAATVGAMPANGLDDVGDYNLRVKATDSYTTYVPANLPTGAKAFRTVTGPAAFTVFWPHGSRYAELAFSSDGNVVYNPLVTTYTQVLSSWTWQ